MALIKKPFKRLTDGGAAAEADSYIDLGKLTFEEEGAALGEPVQHLVRVAEIYRYEDINDLVTLVYNGNLLLVDFTAIANDELAVKRITSEMKSCSRDTGGDLAVVAKNLLLATPAGVKIDRNKIKGNL